MKILIVCSANSGQISPFIKDQAESLINLGIGIEIEFYTIIGRGLFGYLSNFKLLKRKISNYNPDLVHAHYGLSGLLATFQKEKPVVITFHGSDINMRKNILFSLLASRFSKENIFVHPSQPEKIKIKKRINLIPCGVDISLFLPIERSLARNRLGLKQNLIYILFSSHFDNHVKNYPLARKSLELLEFKAELLELKDYTRKEVNLLLNASNLLLVTSFSETGPLIAKEAMACNRPIVSTDVGDVRWLFGETQGCFIASNNPEDVAEKLRKAIVFSQMHGQTEGRKRLIELGLDSVTIAKRIIEVYESLL